MNRCVGFCMLVFLQVARACAIVMGAKQTKEDETPTSPKSPRVAPVDITSGGETPVPALFNYTINAVDAIVDNRSRRTEQNLRVELAATQQRLEAELAATRKELSDMMALLERVAAKVKA